MNTIREKTQCDYGPEHSWIQISNTDRPDVANTSKAWTVMECSNCGHIKWVRNHNNDEMSTASAPRSL